MNQLLLPQTPGVVQDSYGGIHVRGDHGNLQYRINGVVIPEAISGFGQALETRQHADSEPADRRAAAAVRLPHGRRGGHPDAMAARTTSRWPAASA
jgi:hypothetical protein